MLHTHLVEDHMIDPAKQALSLSDCRKPDHPLIYVNKGFEALTGYTREEAIGRNCRFLQGPESDPETVSRMHEAIDQGQPLIVDLLNYRKDGSTFWNRVSLTPVRISSGEVTHYIGIQSDISAMRDLESRLQQIARDLGERALRSNPGANPIEV